jgi:hypothetical protein
MDTTTESGTYNSTSHTFTVGSMSVGMSHKPIYKCDLFGDEWSIVHFVYDKKLVPSWFRRQCQRFFLGTKWTKL